LAQIAKSPFETKQGNLHRLQGMFKKCPMSLDVKQMVECGDMKNTECVLCGECIDYCPKKAIVYSFKKISTK